MYIYKKEGGRSTLKTFKWLCEGNVNDIYFEISISLWNLFNDRNSTKYVYIKNFKGQIFESRMITIQSVNFVTKTALATINLLISWHTYVLLLFLFNIVFPSWYHVSITIQYNCFPPHYCSFSMSFLNYPLTYFCALAPFHWNLVLVDVF